MDRTAVEKLVRGAYAARKVCDVDAMVNCFAEGGRFAMAGSPDASTLPHQATSPDALRNSLAGLSSAFEWKEHEVLAMIIDMPRVAVHCRMRIRSAATGEEVVTEVVDLIEVKDGRIGSFTEFCDTALAGRLLGVGAKAFA